MFVQDASSIVSLVCGTNKIAWTHVNRGMTVLDWQQLECPNFLKGTYMASTYLSDVSMTVRVHVITEILQWPVDYRSCKMAVVLVFSINTWVEVTVRNLNQENNLYFSFLPSGLHSCVTSPISWLLHNREVLHLSPEYDSVPCHGPHEDCRGHAVRSAGAQKPPTQGQHSS